MTRVKKKHPYYNFDKLFSFNAFFMFVIGGRGLGKTYGAKKKAIRNALTKGEQFIYLRRFKSELVARNTFFSDLQANGEFLDWDFRINGNAAEASGAEFRDDKKREWRVIGYFISLSTAQTQKSIAYPDVTLIMFDEFIIEKGATHYLPDEAKAFLQFYSTVDRWQDKTRVLFMANSVSIQNPYFIEYDIRPTPETQWIRAEDDYIVVHIAQSDEFASSVLSTRFGRFIAKTDYANYAVGNEFKDNSDRMIGIKDETYVYLYTLHTKTGKFSIWRSSAIGGYFAQEKLVKQQTVFVTDYDLMREGVTYLPRNAKLLQSLRTAFNNDRFLFDAPQSLNGLLQIFK